MHAFSSRLVAWQRATHEFRPTSVSRLTQEPQAEPRPLSTSDSGSAKVGASGMARPDALVLLPDLLLGTESEQALPAQGF